MVDLNGELKRIASSVNSYMDGFLRGEPSLLYEAAYHLIKGGGKRLRPFVVVEFYRMFGGDEREVLPAAAAVEFIHNFTLVHDDIMDRDDFRRGVPTVHKVYGEPMAILAGDALFAKSYMALLDSEALRRNDDAFRRAVESVTRATVVLCEGQTLDYQLSKASSFSADDYYRLVRAKTSALFVASAELGVIAASRYEYLEDARGFAENMGVAFQLVDDLLGLVGDPAVTGKPRYRGSSRRSSAPAWRTRSARWPNPTSRGRSSTSRASRTARRGTSSGPSRSSSSLGTTEG